MYLEETHRGGYNSGRPESLLPSHTSPMKDLLLMHNNCILVCLQVHLSVLRYTPKVVELTNCTAASQLEL
jgi:hypothetical protein